MLWYLFSKQILLNQQIRNNLELKFVCNMYIINLDLVEKREDKMLVCC